MDAVGIDLQLSDRAYNEYGNNRTVEEERQQERQPDPAPSTPASSDETDSPSSTYETSTELATGTTVPVVDHRDERAGGRGKSTSSTSSSSSSDSRTTAASLYVPEYLTPSISYERQSPSQLLVAVIGRAFDQPEKTATSLQRQVARLPNTETTTPVAKFTPFTVKRKALCRGNFDSQELKKHDLICLCYNASEARILLTGQDGYYTALLKQIEILMGSNKVAFLVSNYNPPADRPSSTPSINTQPHSSDAAPLPTATEFFLLLPPTLRERLSLQPALVPYLERGQVMAWADTPHTRHTERLVEIARLEPNPQGILSLCSIM